MGVSHAPPVTQLGTHTHTHHLLAQTLLTTVSNEVKGKDASSTSNAQFEIPRLRFPGW